MTIKNHPSRQAGSSALLWVALACTLLLALRKPWALYSPQLWAEDGSIFLIQAEQLGWRAFIEPYNGYLHLLPRLVAWIAHLTADPACWPAIYNGLAFTISAALFARIAHPRVDLPAKPGLMLALVLVVGTGEVLINVTNLQWLTAFFLVLHVFTSPAPTLAAQIRDLTLLGIVGLNGPFAIVFAPLLGWRVWRAWPEKNPQRTFHFWAIAILAICAALQGWFVTHAHGGLAFPVSPEPFRPLMGCSIVGSRLITWTFLGPLPVRAWPLWIHAIIGVVSLTALLGWALRADARRPIRTLLVAAFGLVTAACAYRVRADTWEDDNLINGDRYFYISRVLLAWLVVLEMNTTPRAIAIAARALGLAAVLSHAPYFILPAPPNFQWAQHCEPIRRGVPAKIPTLPAGWILEYPGRAPRP